MTTGAGFEPGDPLHPGYLAEVEATHITLTAAPGSVFIAMSRRFPGEQAAGRPVRWTMMEVSVSEAVQLHRWLGQELRKAAALASQPSHMEPCALL